MAVICIEIERADKVDDNLLDGYKVWFYGWTKLYFENFHPWLQRILRKQFKDRDFFGPSKPNDNDYFGSIQDDGGIDTDKRSVIVMPMSTQESIISDKENTNSLLNYIHTSYDTKNSVTGDEYFIPYVAKDTPTKSGNIRGSQQPPKISTNYRVPFRYEQAPEPQQHSKYAQYYGEEFDEGVYEQSPPVDVTNERADPRLTTNFTNLIQNRDKHTGLMNDLLDDKMSTFLQHFKGSGARTGQFAGFVPYILDRRAKDFFRSEIGTKAMIDLRL
ncbi:hypothetical protein GcM1_208003 [Golovinomyces cichoracearum]|uniref:Uncharacterized protein n=1 Tax=Golovinomyces cichoracearum TaxID=62708 RepID=A0A420IW15_9PEZI|nr:hypothetical protein GcM1_208003 [Golovinomyces cichoracearum]